MVHCLTLCSFSFSSLSIFISIYISFKFTTLHINESKITFFECLWNEGGGGLECVYVSLSSAIISTFIVTISQRNKEMNTNWRRLEGNLGFVDEANYL